jgi:hypothetical protein
VFEKKTPLRTSMGSTASTAAGGSVRALHGHDVPGLQSSPSGGKAGDRGARQAAPNPTNASTAQRHEEQFHEAVYKAFSSMDKRGKGVLDVSEFFQALHSRTINVNLTEEEKQEFTNIAGFTPTAQIPYREAIAVLRPLLQNIYRRSTTDWNDWCAVSPSLCSCQRFVSTCA